MQYPRILKKQTLHLLWKYNKGTMAEVLSLIENNELKKWQRFEIVKQVTQDEMPISGLIKLTAEER